MGSIILGVLLVIVGAIFLVRHRAAWQQWKDESGVDARRFHLRQYYRRMQASGLMVLIGLYLFGGNFVVDPYWQIAYWSLVAVLVICLLILAFIDMLSTRSYYGKLQSETLNQRVALEEEATRLQQANSSEHNGHGNSQQ